MSERRISLLRGLSQLKIQSLSHFAANQSASEPMMHTLTRPFELKIDWKAKECGELMVTTSFEVE